MPAGSDGTVWGAHMTTDEHRTKIVAQCAEWKIEIDGGPRGVRRAFGLRPHVVGCSCQLSANEMSAHAGKPCSDLWDRLTAAGIDPTVD